jgi:hypothetical protein
MINGIDLKILMMILRIEKIVLFCKIPFSLVMTRITPRGIPIITAKKKATATMYSVCSHEVAMAGPSQDQSVPI